MKIALITGANQGIGFAIAKLLLEEGITVILTARNEQAGLEALEKLKAYENCYFHQLDVTDTQSIQKAKTFVETKFGKLDILINNAAINYDTWHNAITADLEEIEETLDANLMGVWRVSQTFVPLMQKNHYGRVVNVSSGAGSLASQTGNTPGYSISKLALNGLTLQFANELRRDNILVNTVCPGWVRTNMGGSSAPRTPEEGAEGIVWAALLEDTNVTGKFLRDKKCISL
jgi:NAD(P)-dependent dehydrogenase (short-subunit alcohol dehydrogenase family)